LAATTSCFVTQQLVELDNNSKHNNQDEKKKHSAVLPAVQPRARLGLLQRVDGPQIQLAARAGPIPRGASSALRRPSLSRSCGRCAQSGGPARNCARGRAPCCGQAQSGLHSAGPQGQIAPAV